MAADALSIIPGAVLRNLSDKLYEKRKNATLEVRDSIPRDISGYLAAHQRFHILATSISSQIVPPVLNSFLDQDSRVRYYACEALYNIAKVVRGDFIIYFNKILDALCKLSADSNANVQSAAHLLDRLVKDIVTESDWFIIEEFISLLRERMNVLNPYVRQFLVGWITVLYNVPDIDMHGFLSDFLDGLFNMLSDFSHHEIRQQADAALSEFLQEIKKSPNVDYGRMAEILIRRAGSTDEFTRLTSITWITSL
ncbi:protein VAC14 homolog [Miscanthus floridulus]|uniref:protein VAC14 homolog n=1 Tax=Miscanthus floridulus TaxID=154761 RepID=UPI0034580A84